MVEKKKPFGRPRKYSHTHRPLRLTLYFDPEEERMVRMAAAMDGKTFSEFISVSTVAQARQIVDSQSPEL